MTTIPFRLDRSLVAGVRTLVRHVRTKGWLRPVRHAGVLALGRTAQAVLGMLATALAARALGASAFGQLVMVESLVLGVAQLTRLNPQFALLRYGAQALHDARTRDLQGLIQYCLLTNLLSMTLALAAVMAALEWLGTVAALPAAAEPWARVYASLVVVIVLGSTGRGLLRLFDRWDLLSAQAGVAPLIRAIAAGGLLLADAGLPAFLAAWFGSRAVGRALLVGFAVHDLRRRGLASGLARPAPRFWNPEAGVWRYLGGMHVSRGLTTLRDQGAVLVVGWLLGPSGAGLYRVAEKLGQLVEKPVTKLLKPTLLPELTHQAARGATRRRRKMVLRTAALAGGTALALGGILTAFGRPLIAVTVGPDFVAAYPAMVLMALAFAVQAGIVTFQPLLVSTGHVGLVVAIRALTTAIYFAVLLAALHAFGVTGAGAATLVYMLVLGALFLTLGRGALSQYLHKDAAA